MTAEKTFEDGLAQGRESERSDVVAWIDHIGATLQRTAYRGDEAARLAEHRIQALRDGLAAGVHQGESQNGRE